MTDAAGAPARWGEDYGAVVFWTVAGAAPEGVPCPAMSAKGSSTKGTVQKGKSLQRAAPSPEPPTPPAALGVAQRKLLAEALRRAEETRNVMEDALVSFGRWLLVQVFDDDAAAALAGRRDNPVWRELLARAGGPTLRVSEKLLYVALHIAAHDKRITDESWRSLEPGRKELLLPLDDEALMRKAARHVTALKLTQRATREYVGALLAEQGEAREVRLTAPRIASHMRRFRERVTAGAYQRRALSVLKGADDASRAAVRDEVEAVRAWAEAFLAKTRGDA